MSLSATRNASYYKKKTEINKRDVIAIHALPGNRLALLDSKPELIFYDYSGQEAKITLTVKIRTSMGTILGKDSGMPIKRKIDNHRSLGLVGLPNGQVLYDDQGNYWIDLSEEKPSVNPANPSMDLTRRPAIVCEEEKELGCFRKNSENIFDFYRFGNLSEPIASFQPRFITPYSVLSMDQIGYAIGNGHGSFGYHRRKNSDFEQITFGNVCEFHINSRFDYQALSCRDIAIQETLIHGHRYDDVRLRKTMVVDIKTGVVRSQFRDPVVMVGSFMQGRRWVLADTQGKFLAIFNAEDGTLRSLLFFNNRMNNIVLSNDGTLIVVLYGVGIQILKYNTQRNEALISDKIEKALPNKFCGGVKMLMSEYVADDTDLLPISALRRASLFREDQRQELVRNLLAQTVPSYR